jgi:ABC-2 type transport system permease protein
MSFTLLKAVFKKNWTLLLIFFGALTMYMAVMVSMYDPSDMEALTSMLKLFPAELMKAMGFSELITDLTGYLASWLYGLLMFGFPMVYCIILGNRLVVKMVDNSSFAYLLSTPNSRVKLLLHKVFMQSFPLRCYLPHYSV